MLVATISYHTVAGGLREDPFPSAEVDASGTVYVVWSDCRFRSSCARNDIVLSKSTSETTWGAPTRVPIDSTASSVEHFAPGLGVDRTTAGQSGRLGLTFGDYISTSVPPGRNAFAVIPVGTAPSSSAFNLPMAVPTGGSLTDPAVAPATTPPVVVETVPEPRR